VQLDTVEQGPHAAEPVTRHLLGALALMAGTIVGFLLGRSVGIFGFKVTFSSGLAPVRAARPTLSTRRN
jgi:hypothetical protein